MKFAHIADSHLGGWRQPELRKLNLESFKKAIEISIEEGVDFILFTGDLFDTAFPPIEILKETFSEFRKLKEAGIKAYVIAGSHDYSVSGKSFLEVLETAGLCEICKYEVQKKGDEEKIILKPIIHKTFAIYGYPGKKSGLEIKELRKIEIKEPYENKFRILMLHTTIEDVIENLPIESINLKELPPADYYALGHIHVRFEKKIKNKIYVYAGPTFPNNFKEFEELKHGSFNIVKINGYIEVIKKELPLKEVELVEVELTNGLTGTQKILEELEKRDLKDKIVLLKIFGTLRQGKPSDIKFEEVKNYLQKKEAYSFLKNTSKLETEKKELKIEVQGSEMKKIEEKLIEEYVKENPLELNELIFPLMDLLSDEKQEGETNAAFESRLLSGLEKITNIDLKT